MPPQHWAVSAKILQRRYTKRKSQTCTGKHFEPFWQRWRWRHDIHYLQLCFECRSWILGKSQQAYGCTDSSWLLRVILTPYIPFLNALSFFWPFFTYTSGSRSKVLCVKKKTTSTFTELTHRRVIIGFTSFQTLLWFKLCSGYNVRFIVFESFHGNTETEKTKRRKKGLLPKLFPRPLLDLLFI